MPCVCGPIFLGTGSVVFIRFSRGFVTPKGGGVTFEGIKGLLALLPSLLHLGTLTPSECTPVVPAHWQGSQLCPRAPGVLCMWPCPHTCPPCPLLSVPVPRPWLGRAGISLGGVGQGRSCRQITRGWEQAHHCSFRFFRCRTCRAVTRRKHSFPCFLTLGRVTAHMPFPFLVG